MQIAGLSATEPSARPRDRERDGKQTTDDRFPTRSRFSSTHVILDLSREAMKQIGHDPRSRSRPARPLLFIYDHSGAFAYDEPAPAYDAGHAASPPHRPVTDVQDTDQTLAETPILNIVAFDGMLGAP